MFARLLARLTKPTAVDTHNRPLLGELTNPKDIASFEEWGHAVEAPTDTEPQHRLGMPPFTV